MSHADTLRAYYAAWVADDLEAVLALCSDDLVATNVPIGPIRGTPVSLPYMSSFLFRGALIREWRDYFDVQTVLRQRGLPLDGSRPPRSAAVSGPTPTAVATSAHGG